jgi:hypothetical protein
MTRVERRGGGSLDSLPRRFRTKASPDRVLGDVRRHRGSTAKHDEPRMMLRKAARRKRTRMRREGEMRVG